MKRLRLSSLPHTWLIDIDGTLLRHNGYKQGGDELLEGVLDFWGDIPLEDVIILMSARDERFADSTLSFLRANGIRYNHALFGMPSGERILLNDIKPTGLRTAYAMNLLRDKGFSDVHIEFVE